MGYICIHGHFYQPPRENPWLEAIELQDSAHPYHDWNERINAECYAPNASARILDEEKRIVSIVNNYAKISFNFGPTLLSWMEANDPAVYRAILDGRCGERQDLFRAWVRPRPALQPYDHAAGQRTRQIHAGVLGDSRLRTPVWTPAGRDVAA